MMKRMGRIAGILSASVALITLSACAEMTAPTSRSPNAKIVRGGEALFRGLFFGEGDVASAFPEIWVHGPAALLNLSEDAAVRYEGAKNRIISEIRTADPEFFARFERDIQSGDHTRIADAMDDGSTNLRNAVQRAYPEVVTGPGQLSGSCITFAVAANAVALVNAFVAWNVVAHANAVVNENFFWDLEQIYSKADTQLGRDQVVQLIAERLGDA